METFYNGIGFAEIFKIKLKIAALFAKKVQNEPIFTRKQLKSPSNETMRNQPLLNKINTF